MNSRKMFWPWLLMTLLAVVGSSLAEITAPTELTIIQDGANVRLDWNAVAGASEYNVYKDVVSPPSTAFPLATVGTTTYSDPTSGSDLSFYVVTAVIPSGTLSGTIRDTASVGNGALFQGVLVLAENQDDPAIFGYAYTLANGTYSMEIPVGDYDVTLYKVRRPVYTTTVSITESGPLDDETINYQWPTFSWSTIPASIASDLTLTNDIVWQLTNATSVLANVDFTVEKGTTIVGNFPTLTLIDVELDGNIFVMGSKLLPVVMTSNREPGQALAGDWGGLIINGNAHDNRGTVAVGEGATGPYGQPSGTANNSDNSGIVQYLRLEYAGWQFTPTNQLNGLCLQAVGNGTTIDHVQCIYGADDALEFFGGTVDISYFVATNPEDDGFDWTEGWSGHAHHVFITEYADLSDRGIESDNLEQDNNALPRANAKLANFTIIGKEGNSAGGSEGDYGVTHRRGTLFQDFNFVVTHARAAGFDLDDAATSSSAVGGASRFDYSIFWDNGPAATEVIDASTGAGIGDGHFLVENAEWQLSPTCAHTASFPVESTDLCAPVGWTQDISNFRGCGFVGSNATTIVANPMLASVGYPSGYDGRPAAGSPALVPANAAPIGTITSYGLPYAPYVGAFNGPTDDWHIGWTIFP